MGKRDSPKSEWDTGISDPGAFKLDYFRHVKMISFQNISTFLTFILGLPFLITPERGGKEAAWAENGGKCITQNWMRHRWFSTWGIQTGPFKAC